MPKSFKGVLKEYGAGQLHSGGSGKVVTNPKQAVAIAYSEQRQRKHQPIHNLKHYAHPKKTR